MKPETKAPGRLGADPGAHSSTSTVPAKNTTGRQAALQGPFPGFNEAAAFCRGKLLSLDPRYHGPWRAHLRAVVENT